MGLAFDCTNPQVGKDRRQKATSGVTLYTVGMPLIHVGKVSALPTDSVMEVLVGHQPYAICNVGGTIHAIDGVCLHRGGPLGQGQIHDGRVVCPYHLWEFDCRTGAYDYDPTKGVATFAVKIEGDNILLQVP